MVVIADQGVEATGYIARVVAELLPRQVTMHIVPWGEPTLDSVDAAASVVRAAGDAVVIGVGGGSALDIAKQAAVVGTGDSVCRVVPAVCGTVAGPPADRRHPHDVGHRRGGHAHVHRRRSGRPQVVDLGRRDAARHRRARSDCCGHHAPRRHRRHRARRLRPCDRGVQRSAAQLGRVGIRPAIARAGTCAPAASRCRRHRSGVTTGDAGGSVPRRHRDRQLRYRRRPFDRSRARLALPRPSRDLGGRRPACRVGVEHHRRARRRIATRRSRWTAMSTRSPTCLRELCVDAGLDEAIGSRDVGMSVDEIAATMNHVENQPMLHNNSREVRRRAASHVGRAHRRRVARSAAMSDHP